MTANDKTSAGSGRGDWQTPPDLFERLNRRYQFDYDAFASHENALCRTYSTVEGTFRSNGAPCGCSEGIRCSRYRIEQIDSLDGLRQDWSGRRVFMNPPYSAGLIGRCAEAAARWRNEARVIVAVLPDARDTRWWRSSVKPYAQDFPIGRIRFINPDTGLPGGSPPGGTAIVVWTPDWMNP